MRLSGLQRFTLLECYAHAKPRLSRRAVHAYYRKTAKPPEDIQEAVTKSLERMIDKGLLIGYGHRTPKKWFIEEIKLTPPGRRSARTLLGVQQSLPWRKAKSRKISLKPC